MSMANYYVTWIQELTEFANVEADSEEEAIRIAKTEKGLDVDSEASSPPKKYKAVLDE